MSALALCLSCNNSLRAVVSGSQDPMIVKTSQSQDNGKWQGLAQAIGKANNVYEV